MRILENHTIIKIGILLMVMIVLLAGNLYLHVSRKKSFLSACIHTASFFGGVSLFSFFMELSILDLNFEIYFHKIRNIAVVLCALMIPVVFGIYLIGRTSQTLISPSLSAAFYGIEDLAVICDYQGNIVETNQPERMSRLLGENCMSLEEIKTRFLMLAPFPDHPAIITGLKDIKSQQQFEMQIGDGGEFYLITVSPIMADKRSCIGASIVIHDIKEEKKLLLEIDRQNQYLLSANRKLTDYVRIADVLEAETERLQLFQKVQSDLVVKIEAAIAAIKKVQNAEQTDLKDYQKSVKGISSQLREVYQDIRISIQNITGRKGGVGQ